MKIHYQCSNCGKRFQISPIPGVPDGMFVKWWNRIVDNQCKGQKIRKYYIVNGEYMEAKED